MGRHQLSRLTPAPAFEKSEREGVVDAKPAQQQLSNHIVCTLMREVGADPLLDAVPVLTQAGWCRQSSDEAQTEGGSGQSCSS